MSKILLLSQSIFEASTDYLCKWLLYHNTRFERFNGEDLFTLNSLTELPQDQDIDLVWYRRRINKFPNVDYSFRKQHVSNAFTLRNFLNSEFKALYFYLLEKIDIKKYVNDPFVFNNINKLRVIQLAEKNGLITPMTEVVTTRAAVQNLVEKYEQIIIKPLSEVIYLEDENYQHYNMLTKIINVKNINYVPLHFFPSLVQEAIEKKMEIRIFYLYGQFYSMAIYSQNNKNTKQDFRNYDHRRPNRTVPYKIPDELENKLSILMQELGFNMGSIDMILTPEGKYVFLEINPEGQFGMVSHPCNYYLERELALTFINKISYEK
jgi:ATP-GRASP peptide maturase of grasp-with-spasm system